MQLRGSGDIRQLRTALASLESLVSKLAESSEPYSIEEMLDVYVEATTTLSREFAALARRVLIMGDSVVEKTRGLVERELEARHGRRIRVRSYTRITHVLLEYLVKHEGEPVAASRLRLLSGDQVHTERRLREVRELGFRLSWYREGPETFYVLESARPDLDAGAAYHFKRALELDSSRPAPESE